MVEQIALPRYLIRAKGKYDDRLATFRDRDNLLLVPANDISALQEVFARADAEGLFIEVMAIEPVQGEGNPGQCVTREFYDEARRLTMEHGSMLLVDSIQNWYPRSGLPIHHRLRGIPRC